MCRTIRHRTAAFGCRKILRANSSPKFQSARLSRCNSAKRAFSVASLARTSKSGSRSIALNHARRPATGGSRPGRKAPCHLPLPRAQVCRLLLHCGRISWCARFGPTLAGIQSPTLRAVLNNPTTSIRAGARSRAGGSEVSPAGVSCPFTLWANDSGSLALGAT